MKFSDESFIPMLFGGDINTYSVARAFYEEYNVKSHVFGKFATGPSYGSRITEYTANDKIDTDEVFLDTVRKFCDAHKDKKVLTIGCGDSYTALISRNKNSLPENAIAPYIDFELMNSLQQKELFYKLCEKHGIDYPGTLVYRNGDTLPETLPFIFPVILKPSNGINYWEHPFDTQEKVYTIDNRESLEKVINDIYAAGYEDSLIIQDMIPGNDEYMRVLTSYSDHNGKVKMMCLGHVLLEEHTPHGKGNHAVIITEFEAGLMKKVKNLLEDLHYIGYSNFDIKYDSRDNKYKFFEINTRQGRSNFYVTGSGFNVARYFVEEYIRERDLPLLVAKKEHLWLVVPKPVAKKYVKDPENKKKLKKLLREGKFVNPVFMKGDLKLNRTLRMLKQHFSHYSKYKKYYN
ncbi:D-aspartate ligase [Eubacterium ruminantium]|nr:D-aspartate ligase [Eubacterium ruminantium]